MLKVIVFHTASMMERSYGQCMIPCHKMTNFNFLMVMKITCRRLFSCAKGLIYAMSAESITLIWKMLIGKLT